MIIFNLLSSSSCIIMFGLICSKPCKCKFRGKQRDSCVDNGHWIYYVDLHISEKILRISKSISSTTVQINIDDEKIYHWTRNKSGISESHW